MKIGKLNILVSYAYMTDRLLKELELIKDDIDLYIDSGAFTAWKQGRTITVKEYSDFLNKLPMKPRGAFTLDVIGDPEGSLRQYKQLKALGHDVIPIFTRGESLDMIDKYYESSDIIGIGGLVGTAGNKGFVKTVMTKIDGRKCHLLGFTSLPWVSRYRPTTIDSSGWSGGLRFGNIALWTPDLKKVMAEKKDFIKRPCKAILDVFKFYEEDPRYLAKKDQWKNSGRGDSALERVVLKAGVLHSLAIEHQLGTKMFLACSSDWQVRLIHKAYKFWRKRYGTQ